MNDLCRDGEMRWNWTNGCELLNCFGANASFGALMFFKIVWFFILMMVEYGLPVNALENGLAMVATFLLFLLSYPLIEILQFWFCTWTLVFRSELADFGFRFIFYFCFFFLVSNPINAVYGFFNLLFSLLPIIIFTAFLSSSSLQTHL